MKCAADKTDVLQEIINIGLGRGANVLNTMVGSHVALQVPSLKILSPDEFEQEIREYGKEPFVCVNLPFRSNFSGVAELVFPLQSASELITALTRGQPDNGDMDSIRTGTLCEVGNIVLNAVMGTISNLIGFKFDYSIPCCTEGDSKSLLPLHMTMLDPKVLLAHTHFKIEDLEIHGSIILFFGIRSFDKLLEAVANYRGGSTQ